jgi:3-oxoacyl-[acyl-carrier-protein] synthase III
LAPEKVLEIAAYGAWNGGEIIDNSVYEKKGMSFKGDQPVTDESIQARIGVRTRRCAAPDERIAQASMQDLMDASDLDFSRVKLVIGATNIGEDKNDPGPLVRHPYSLIKDQCPDATAIDIYAGCPGFNVAAELAFMLSLTGVLREGDISIIVGAENLHRAKCFKEDDTSQIIFGDDSLARWRLCRWKGTRAKTLRRGRPRRSGSCAETIFPTGSSWTTSSA